MELDEALEVLANLDREQVDYVLVGGAAVVFHGIVRATEDLDIFTRLGEFASFEDLEVQQIESGGIKIKVASPRTLYWMKKDTVREIDHMDAERLREKFGIEETNKK
jgi:hypothetical protein